MWTPAVVQRLVPRLSLDTCSVEEGKNLCPVLATLADKLPVFWRLNGWDRPHCLHRLEDAIAWTRVVSNNDDEALLMRAAQRFLKASVPIAEQLALPVKRDLSRVNVADHRGDPGVEPKRASLSRYSFNPRQNYSQHVTRLKALLLFIWRLPRQQMDDGWARACLVQAARCEGLVSEAKSAEEAEDTGLRAVTFVAYALLDLACDQPRTTVPRTRYELFCRALTLTLSQHGAVEDVAVDTPNKVVQIVRTCLYTLRLSAAVPIAGQLDPSGDTPSLAFIRRLCRDPTELGRQRAVVSLLDLNDSCRSMRVATRLSVRVDDEQLLRGVCVLMVKDCLRYSLVDVRVAVGRLTDLLCSKMVTLCDRLAALRGHTGGACSFQSLRKLVRCADQVCGQTEQPDISIINNKDCGVALTVGPSGQSRRGMALCSAEEKTAMEAIAASLQNSPGESALLERQALLKCVDQCHCIVAALLQLCAPGSGRSTEHGRLQLCRNPTDSSSISSLSCDRSRRCLLVRFLCQKGGSQDSAVVYRALPPRQSMLTAVLLCGFRYLCSIVVHGDVRADDGVAVALTLLQVGHGTVGAVCPRGLHCPLAAKLHMSFRHNGSVVQVPPKGSCCWSQDRKGDKNEDSLRNDILQMWGLGLAGEQWVQSCAGQVRWGDLRKAATILVRLDSSVLKLDGSELVQTLTVRQFGHSQKTSDVFYTGTDAALVSEHQALRLCILFCQLLGQQFPFGSRTLCSRRSETALSTARRLHVLETAAAVDDVLLGAIAGAFGLHRSAAKYKSPLQRRALVSAMLTDGHVLLKLPCGRTAACATCGRGTGSPLIRCRQEPACGSASPRRAAAQQAAARTRAR